MRIVQLLLLLAAGLLEARGTLPVLEGLHQRFEFQYSFKPPFVANDKGQIPFWEHGGGRDIIVEYLAYPQCLLAQTH